MTIGGTLARARRDAGLSIAEISSQTCIRRTVIDGIEHDDYSACGGDFYARGNIRAIARALGVDSQPLIEAYDAARRPVEKIAAAKPSEPVMTAQAPDAFQSGADTEPVPAIKGAAPRATGGLSVPITGEPHNAASGPPDPVTSAATAMPAHAATAAGAYWPVRLPSSDRRPFIWFGLGAALLAVAALGGILLVVGTSGHPVSHAVAAGRHRGGGAAAVHPARTRPGHSASPAGGTSSASPASSRTAGVLVPASIAAFGPGGIGHGDSPQLARRALPGRGGTPWHSDWYTTPHFGNLQSGTGLLMNLGRMATITSVQIVLGSRRGANLTVRIGDSPALARLSPVAHVYRAGGVVRLRTAPTRGRYVLVWFTRLPSNRVGTFQVSVFQIKLRGYRAP